MGPEIFSHNLNPRTEDMKRDSKDLLSKDVSKDQLATDSLNPSLNAQTLYVMAVLGLFFFCDAFRGSGLFVLLQRVVRITARKPSSPSCQSVVC